MQSATEFDESVAKMNTLLGEIGRCASHCRRVLDMSYCMCSTNLQRRRVSIKLVQIITRCLASSWIKLILRVGCRVGCTVLGDGVV